jgi:hypothetical protein
MSAVSPHLLAYSEDASTGVVPIAMSVAMSIAMAAASGTAVAGTTSWALSVCTGGLGVILVMLVGGTVGGRVMVARGGVAMTVVVAVAVAVAVAVGGSVSS